MCRRQNRKPKTRSIAPTIATTPTLIPTFAPVERPPEPGAGGLDVCVVPVAVEEFDVDVAEEVEDTDVDGVIVGVATFIVENLESEMTPSWMGLKENLWPSWGAVMLELIVAPPPSFLFKCHEVPFALLKR